MATFNFDMQRIGQTISRHRREHNMTQMALADEMGVSFQAVSNWERGQSMPDISKLPELAELFGTTIDELLGRHSPLIQKAVEDKLDELPEVNVEELAEAAPLLPPCQMDELTNKLLAMPTLPDMTELLPYLPTAQVDKLLRQHAAEGDDNLAQYAVFASSAAVDEAALNKLEHKGSISQLVPFMSQEAINHLVRSCEASDQSITFLLPFISSSLLNELAISRLQQGRSITEFLPFLDQETLLQLFSAASSKD